MIKIYLHIEYHVNKMYFTRIYVSVMPFVSDQSARRRSADKQQELSLFRSHVMAAQAAELSHVAVFPCIWLNPWSLMEKKGVDLSHLVYFYWFIIDFYAQIRLTRKKSHSMKTDFPQFYMWQHCIFYTRKRPIWLARTTRLANPA
jgi:hypothetical protein